MSKNDLSVYRSPAEGFSPEPQLVPDLTPWRCRWFGHKLRGERIRRSLTTEERDSLKEFNKKYGSGFVYTEITDFPSARVRSSDFTHVWCSRCGREWKRPDKEE